MTRTAKISNAGEDLPATELPPCEETQPLPRRKQVVYNKPPPPSPTIKAPDGGWGWFVVLGSALTHVIIGGQERASGVLYLEILHKFNRSAAVTAWVTSLSSAIRLLCGPLASFFSNRFSLRKVSFAGGVLLGLGFLLSSFADSLEYFFFSYSFLGGFGKCLSYTCCMIIVGQYFDKRRGLAVGLATAGVGIGMFVFPPLMEWLFQTYAYFGTMVLMAGISLNLCVCSMLYRPLRENLHPPLSWKPPLLKVESENVELLTLSKMDEDEAAGAMASESSKKKMPKTAFSPPPIRDSTLSGVNRPSRISIAHSVSYQPISSKDKNCCSAIKRFLFGDKYTDESKVLLNFNLLKDLHFCLFLFSISVFTLAYQSVPLFIPALAIQKGVSEMNAAILMSISGVTDFISRIFMSIFLDLKHIKPYRRYFYTLISAFNVMILLICPVAVTFTEFASVSAVYGVLSGGYVSQKSVIIVDLLGVDKLSSSFGWTACFQGIGSLIGPPVAGKLKDVFDTYEYAFYFSGGMVATGVLSFFISNLIYYCQQRKLKS